MARKALVPPGAKRGGRGQKPPIPPAFGGKGRGAVGKARPGPGAPLPPLPPRPRPRLGAGMPPAMAPPMMRGPVVAVHFPPRGGEEGAEGAGAMGPAMRGGVGASPVSRRLAQAMRGGRMPF